MSSRSLSADRNLLFGVLALQADLIDSDQFASACTLWSADKETSLADVLIKQGWLTREDRALVESLLQRKLKKHHGDVGASLAAATTDEVRASLAGVADDDVRRSLATTPPQPGPVVLATTAYVPEKGDRYTRSRLHATGGIGRVWLARDANLARDVALKELRPERAGNPAVSARFLKEAQITGQLEHPSIVPIYEVGQHSDDRPPYYTMRFVRGRTLSEAVLAYHERRKRGQATPLEQRELLGAFVGVCNAVAYAHSRGVLHRDLKPKNVVLGDFGEVIVLDWGLARLMDQRDGEDAAPLDVPADHDVQATIQGQVLGTPAYMAPEQAEGRLDLLGPATDVYGLGAILYEILSGEPPFTGSETTQLLRKVIHQPPLRPRNIIPTTPPALETVCLKALAKKPANRYGSASELATEVRHFLADEPVSAYREPPLRRLARWGRRHRSLVAGAAVLLVALVIGLSAGTVLLGQANARIQREQAETAKERDRADSNFQKARKAVDDYLTQVSENTLLKSPLPGLQPLRKELLRTALTYYEDFVTEHKEDPALRADLALALARSGKVSITLGTKEEGYALLRQARDQLEKLVQEQPGRAEHRSELVDVYLYLGKAQIRKPEESAERLADLKRALELAEQLVGEDGNNNDYRALLAKCYEGMAGWQADNSRAVEELATRQKSAQLWNDLARRDPKFRRDAASAAMNLGYYYTRLGNPICLRYHEEARAQLEKLVKADPTDVEALAELRRAHTNIGYAHALVESRPDLALLSYINAGSVVDQLTRDHPAVISYQRQKAVNLSMMGSALILMYNAPAADRALRDGQLILDRLHRQHPEEIGILNELSELHVQRGRLNYVLLRKPGEAVKELKLAEDYQQKAFNANPSDLENRTGLARTLRDLGMAQQSAGDLPAAEGSFRRSVELNEQVESAARKRSVLVLRQLLAGYSVLAGVEESLGHVEAAARHHEQMVRIWNKELAPTNTSAVIVVTVAQGELRRGQFLARSGQPAQAVRELEEAERLLQKIVRTARNELYDLACVHAQLSATLGADQPAPDAEILARRLRYAEQAVAELKDFIRVGGILTSDFLTRAPALQPLAGRPDFQALVAQRKAIESAVKENSERNERARRYALDGDHARAVTEVQPVLTSKYATAVDVYNVACVYSLASAAVGKDAKLKAEEQAKRGHEYGDRAMDLLRQAVKKGYRRYAEVNHMKGDTDLAPLRERTDYKKLIEQLEAALGAPVGKGKKAARSP